MWTYGIALGATEMVSKWKAESTIRKIASRPSASTSLNSWSPWMNLTRTSVKCRPQMSQKPPGWTKLAANTPKTVEDLILADDLRELGAVSMADAIDEAPGHKYVEMCRWYLRNMIDPAPAAVHQ